MTQDLKDKIALFCDINKESVIECRDAESLYEIPLQLVTKIWTISSLNVYN